MEKFKEKMKMKIEDNKAAFIILGAMVITFSVVIGIYEYIKYNQLEEVNSNPETAEIQEAETANINDKTNDIANEVESKIDEKKAKKENEEEYEKLKSENKISSAADKYYIKVNYGAQVVTVYTKDSNGKYTKPVRAMVCSTGTYTPTSGVYRTLGKGNWWPLMGDVYGQYSTWICGDILFHSVPYLKSGDKSSLEYWAYDQLGQRVSMGCVRLTVADAYWIYNNCPVGTQVEFYSSSNPGPLEKPTTRKISSAPNNVRGWDPTDPDSRNPWPKYLKKLEADKDNDKNNTKNEIKNEVANEVTNTITNDIANETVNEVTNDIVNEVVNEPINNVINDTVNDVNETTEPTVNDVEINETVNAIPNNEEKLPEDTYVNGITTSN